MKTLIVAAIVLFSGFGSVATYSNLQPTTNPQLTASSSVLQATANPQADQTGGNGQNFELQPALGYNALNWNTNIEVQ